VTGGSSILVTGATGFVGSALVRRLLADCRSVIAVSRSDVAPDKFAEKVRWCGVDAIDAETDWMSILGGCDTVVHLAARVHVMNEISLDPLAEFRRVNVAGTERLARQAAMSGVRRFIFLSSIKVNGEETMPGVPFRPDDTPNPADAYGMSKLEAEKALCRVAADTGLEIVIIRPPLIHGLGVKGNLQTMMRWLARGVPLPFSSLDNRRSLVGLDNLCDLIAVCLNHPAAKGETFLVSDGTDLSTAELLRMTGDAMGRPARLFPIPTSWLVGMAAFVGKMDLARRLCSNLQVDISKTRQLLGWEPVLDIETGLGRMAAVPV
jgi:nucleoside-diphosphate-sugar epimerase